MTTPAAIGLAGAPDLIEPVVGFRLWRLRDSGLRSLHCDEPWPSATLAARCLAHGHPGEPAPAPACGCGIYAWYGPTPRLAVGGTPDLVAGAVVMWGRVELHATGMRAQWARVVALALPAWHGAKRRALVAAAARLGVPAVAHRDVPAVASTEGAPVPDGLKPAPAGASAGRGRQSLG